MAKIIIDGKEYDVTVGKNLLETCLSLGYNLPYFCWHPAMGSVGACRQCAVIKYRDEQDETGKLVMACMEPVTDNIRISIIDPEAVRFRKQIIEWLMTNHPHDCPVCDEGGECHLQDMTTMTGHDYRRFRFKKRTYRNQYLGPFINHEMNRCIQCFRCVRFYRDYAGGNDLDVFASHNNLYFGRSKDGILENEFSGNLAEVCPTGVFTDKTLKKHYTRKWDLTTAPSLCVHCSLGCNTIAGERYGTVRRVSSRYNGEVNGYFLCDRGRFGYEYINHEDRIKKVHAHSPAFITTDQPVESIPPPVEAIAHSDGTSASPVETISPSGESIFLSAEEGIRKAVEFISNGRNVVGIGSPRASIEANYALKKLVGNDRFYAGVNKLQHNMIKRIQEILTDYPVQTPGLQEISKCDAVFILGEDLTNTAPMMALSVRQAVRQQPKEKASSLNIPLWQDAAVREVIQDDKGPLFIAAPFATKLDEIATKTYYAAPSELADLGFAVARILDSEIDKPINPSLAWEIATALKNAKRPLIISGTSCMDALLIEAASNVAQAACKLNPATKASYVVPDCNSMGLAMMADKPLDAITEDSQKIDTLIVLENDLFIRSHKTTIGEILMMSGNIIVLDYLKNETTQKADLLLPAAAVVESEGTFINQEGRAQRYFSVYRPSEEIMESWRWLTLIEANNRILLNGIPGGSYSRKNDINAGDYNYQTLVTEMVNSHPQFNGIQNLTPPPGFRIAGQKIAREPHRYSGRTSMHAHENVSEAKPPEDPDSALSYTMEGFQGQEPSSLIPFFWAPGWNSVQSINKYQIEVGGPLHGGDPGLRLLEPKSDARSVYFRNLTAKKAEQGKELVAVAKHHIFGSEELSKHSPGIAELSPGPYIGISEEEAVRLHTKEDDIVEVEWNGHSFTEKTKIIKGLAPGLVAIPPGVLKPFVFTGQHSITLKKLNND